MLFLFLGAGSRWHGDVREGRQDPQLRVGSLHVKGLLPGLWRMCLLRSQTRCLLLSDHQDQLMSSAGTPVPWPWDLQVSKIPVEVMGGVMRRVKRAPGLAVQVNPHLCQVQAPAPGSQEAMFPVASPVPSPRGPPPSVEIPWLEKRQWLGPLCEVENNPQQWFSAGGGGWVDIGQRPETFMVVTFGGCHRLPVGEGQRSCQHLVKTRLALPQRVIIWPQSLKC